MWEKVKKFLVRARNWFTAKAIWGWVEGFTEFVADYWFGCCLAAVLLLALGQLEMRRFDKSPFLPNTTEAVSFTQKRVNEQKEASDRFEGAKTREEEDIISSHLRRRHRLQTMVDLHERKMSGLSQGLKRWDSTIVPLLDNEEGKHIAVNPKNVELFFAVFDAFERNEAEALVAGHRLALKTFKQRCDDSIAADYNPSGIMSALSELEKMKQHSVDVRRSLDTSIRQIENIERSDTSAAITLKDFFLKVKEAKEAEIQKVTVDGIRREKTFTGQREWENRDLFITKATLVGTATDTYGNSGGPMRLIVGSRKGNRFNADVYYYGKWNYRAHIELEGVVDGNKIVMKTTRIVRNRQLKNGVVWEGTITGDKLQGRWNWTNGRKSEEGEFEFQPED